MDGDRELRDGAHALAAAARSLLPAGSTDTNGLDCADTVQQRVLSNQMIEALDTELGRLLVETGLATRGPDGALLYDPERTDTMVIMVGDNGTLGYTVKAAVRSHPRQGHGVPDRASGCRWSLPGRW